MSQQKRPDELRVPLIGAGVLVGFIGLLTASAQLTGVGAWRASVDAPVETLTLVFEDRADGAVIASDAATGRQVRVYAAGGHGFVRGALRAVAHKRKVAGLPSDAPFQISRHADGKLVIVDPTTGARVILNGFGAPNAEEIDVLFEESAA